MAKDFDLSNASELPQPLVTWMTKTDSQLTNLALGQQEVKDAVKGIDGKLVTAVTERALLQNDMGAVKERIRDLENRTDDIPSIRKDVADITKSVEFLIADHKKQNGGSKQQLAMLGIVITIAASVISTGIGWFLFQVLPDVIALLGG